MIRRIFVTLTGGDGDPVALATAFGSAAQLGAHVDAALLRFDQHYVRPKLGEPVPPGLFEEIASFLADRDAVEDTARRHFETARQLAGAAVAAEPPGPGGLSARWLGIRPAERIVRDGRLADLLVIGPGSGVERANRIRIAALATAGRPLLLAPPTAPASLGERVVIAWNGNAGAAQAVAGALPFLAAARAVHVITVKTGRTRSSEGERLVDYLRWHRIAAASHVLPETGSVGATLLAAADQHAADLLVIGGYVQNRIQELLLGGVTAHALGHAALPVLIANR